jgi:hypothetical protein
MLMQLAVCAAALLLFLLPQCAAAAAAAALAEQVRLLRLLRLLRCAAAASSRVEGFCEQRERAGEAASEPTCKPASYPPV